MSDHHHFAFRFLMRMEPVEPSDGLLVCPQGCIILSHYGRNVPDGWAECNGENGTPDLRQHAITYVPPERPEDCSGLVYLP